MEWCALVILGNKISKTHGKSSGHENSSHKGSVANDEENNEKVEQFFLVQFFLVFLVVDVFFLVQKQVTSLCY